MHGGGEERPCGPRVLLKLSSKFRSILIYSISHQEGRIDIVFLKLATTALKE